ncbi:MAG: fasciclin domain-containing protein [Cyclobacteriaceae bacterium]
MKKAFNLLMSMRHGGLPIFLMGILLVSCAEEEIATIDDNEVLGDPQSLYNQINNNSDFSTFIDAVNKAGLTIELREDSDLKTVFVPTNEAFQGVDINSLSMSELNAILSYHIINDSLPIGAIETKKYATPNPDSKFLEVSAVENNQVILNDGQATASDSETASNGFYYTVDNLLIPRNDIVETADENGLNSLIAALGRIDNLADAADNEEANLTVFAPSDQAFTDFLAQFDMYDELADVPDNVLATILQYHIVEGEYFADDLSGASVETLQGESIVGNDVIPNVTTADVRSSNGVVHVIDQVLVPTYISEVLGTVLEPALLDPDGRFTTLIAAIDSAGLRPTLLGTGPFTIFAPTNAGFEAAGITDLGKFTADSLSDVLLYHVISGAQVEAADVSAGPVMTEGGTFYVSDVDGNFVINGKSEIVVTDIPAGNGVVHALDYTLIPPSENIVELASDGFTELAAAMVATGLDGTLSTGGPYTVFAPTNAAFEALYSELEVEGPGEVNNTTLTNILRHHVIPSSRLFSVDLQESEVAALNGSLTINFTSDAVQILQTGSDATVTNTDMLATNGVIHTIDKVLIP